MSAKTEKTILFNLFSRNLQFLRRHPNIEIEPDFEEGVVCPQCFRCYDKSALIQVGNSNCLTLEHVPPKGITFKSIKILTCKECNDLSGYNLDIDLKKEQEIYDFFHMVPSSRMDTVIIIEDEIVTRGVVQITDERKIRINLDSSRTSPENLLKLNQRLKAGMTSPNFNLQFKGYRTKRPEVALLRVAYLLAFSKFGYGFLVNEGLVKVREQIKHPNKEILPHLGSILANFDDIPVGYYVLTEPLELKSFLVVFQIQQRKHGFILPGPEYPGIEIYNQMRRLIESKQNLKFHVKHIKDAPFLKEEAYVLAPIDLFKNA